MIAMRADEFDEPVLEGAAQRVTISRLVFQQVRRGPESLIDARPIQQRLDRVHFAFIGRSDVTNHRNFVRIGQQQQRGAFVLSDRCRHDSPNSALVGDKRNLRGRERTIRRSASSACPETGGPCEAIGRP